MPLHADDGWQLRVVGHIGSTVHENAFAFRQDGEHTDPPTALAEEWNTHFNSLYLAAMGDNYALDQVEVRPLWSVHGDVGKPGNIVDASGAGAGTRSAFGADWLPPWLCMLVRIHSSRGGKGWHSRFYLSNLNEAEVAGETISAGVGSALTETQTLADQIHSRWISGGWDAMHLVTFSPHKMKLNSTGAEHYIIDSADTVSAPAISIDVSTRLTSNRGRRHR